MNKLNYTRRAFCLTAVGALCCGFPAVSFSADEGIDLSRWRDSSSRRAGTRQTLKVGKVEIGLVWIPAGEFDMGSPASEQGRQGDEEPIHVKLSRGYWFLETEVTQALYEEVIGTNPSPKKGKYLPVVDVSWDDATKFCEEATKLLPKGMTVSLPTEAEWENACRSGTKTAYSYGAVADPGKMNCDESRKNGTVPVKSYSANAWGLYDMHGNVYEWTRDGYVRSYVGEYGSGTVVDPECEPASPVSGAFRGGSNTAGARAVRGGGWTEGARRSNALNCRSARRGYSSPGTRNNRLGFRFIVRCD